MKFPRPLEEVRFLKRYKRFFADVELSTGEKLTVHVPNTGSLKGLVETPRPALISRSEDPTRKLKGTLEMLQSDNRAWVGVNTQSPNKLVAELIEAKGYEPWQIWKHYQPEVPLPSKSRIDFVLSNSAEKLKPDHFLTRHKEPYHFLEVKNVTMAQGETALFPDAKSERALKHIHELMEQMALGAKVEMVFVIQREDCRHFRPAEQIDPDYARALQDAHSRGLRISALPCRLSPQEIVLTKNPLELVW